MPHVPPPPTSAAARRRAKRLYDRLDALYPDAHCSLDFKNPFELLIATILSAQCTDARVNLTTPALFKAYPTPQAMADASLLELESLIRSTGFFRNKAKSLKGAATRIAEVYQGRVPETMDDLLTLPGVARKTANVVLGNAFGINVGIPVDTHIGRLSRRLAFTSPNATPAKTEQDLVAQFPTALLCQTAHLLIAHGRAVCHARNPRCGECPIRKSCPRVGLLFADQTHVTPAQAFRRTRKPH